MDKETLIRLATPASIALLATSIFSFPLITKANYGKALGTVNDPIYIICLYPKKGGTFYSGFKGC